MVEIPEELARSIQAGECVLWVGAGFGGLAGRPGWEPLLERLIGDCPEKDRPSLQDLLEQGRLRTVLTYVHRHFGDEPLARLLESVSAEKRGEPPEGVSRLVEMPWRACFATTYADLVQQIFSRGGRTPEVLSHLDVHYLSLRDQRDFFILRTPPTGRAMRADGVLFDLVEEVVRSRTILFLGFEPDDPDLVQVLDLFDRIGRGREHFAILPLVSEPEAEEWFDRFGIRVVPAPEELDFTRVFEALSEACAKVAVRPSDVDGDLSILDLTRAVRNVDLRADLAVDVALTLDIEGLQHLVEALPGGSLQNVPSATLLRLGSVMLAHGKIDRARRCFQQVASTNASREHVNLARFNLAMTALAEGDRSAAVEGLSACAEAERSLALLPPRFELREIQARAGAQLMLTARDRTSKDDFDIVVSTLSRPAGGQEEVRFMNGVRELSQVGHRAIASACGGFADGRLFGVMYAPTPGFLLSDTLDGDPMALDKALELVLPLVEGLEACHARGVLHRCINPQHIIVGPNGPVLTAFGFPPVIGFTRPSVREVNEGYMAPEVRLWGTASAASDAYGVAAVLYRCLTGQVPQGSVPPPSVVVEDLDPRLDPLLQSALHPDPSRRLPLPELRKQLRHIASTPDVGRAQRLTTHGPEPGRETVVDLPISPSAVPSTAESTAATSSSVAEAGVPMPVPAQGMAAPASTRIVLPQDPDDLEAWAWILDRKPTHLEAREAIARIESEAREAGRWDRVAEVLGVRAQHTQIQHERVELLRELIDLFEHKLGAPANAFESMQSLVEEVEVSEQLGLVDELVRLAGVTGQWAKLADSLLIVAERATEPADQARLYGELGKVFAERLGATDRAVASYQKAVELEPREDLYQPLVPLYRKLGRPTELATTLLSLADLREGESRNETLLQAARVLREELGDAEGAFGTLEVLLADDPENAAALEAAESVARELERWDALVDILSRRADAMFDPAASSGLRREAAELALDKLDAWQLAAEQLRKLIEVDRSSRDAAARLAELLRPRVAEDPALRPSLIDALGVLADLAEKNDEKALVLAERAALLDEEPDAKDQAMDCREQILDLLPVERDVCKDAAAALEKHYRRQEDDAALERLFLRQARADETDESFRARAWEKILEIRKGPRADEEGVIEALEALGALAPGEKRWRDELLQRYLEREEFAKAGPLIRAQVFEETDPKRKAELLLRGGILREQIGKVDGAFEALEEAVALDPTLTEAWLALRDLYAQRGQPLKAVEAQVSGARSHANRMERSRLLLDAARRYMDELDRPERAVDLLEEIVAQDPDHREAMSALLERLVATGDLVRAFPHAQTYVMQVRSQAPDDHAGNLRALSLAGRCALAADDKERARDYLEKARGLDATNLDVLRLLADLDLEAGRWTEALRNYQSVVLGMGEKMSPGEQSRLYACMAKARVGMGEPAKAAQMAERAVDLDPDNEEAIEQLVSLGNEVGGPAAAVKAKRKLVDLLVRRETRSDDQAHKNALVEQRIALLQEIADLQVEALKLPDEAVRTLEEILALRPDDPAVLHRILDLFTSEKRWRDATNVLARLADAQTIDSHRAKYLYAGAVLLRDNVGDAQTATDWLRRVIDADPLHEKAFTGYVAELRKQGSWKQLADAIRARLKALPKDTAPAVYVELFAALGDAYERLGEEKTALAAFDQAAKLSAKAGETDDVQRDRRMKVMGMAIQLGEDELEKAVTHAHALIAAMPMEFETYHRLVEIYLKQGQRDRARAISKTLRFLKQADEAELELAEHGGAGSSTARSSINREAWRRSIYHRLEDPRISDLFTIIWPMVAAREGRTHDHHAVSRDRRVEVMIQSPTALARYLAYACQILDVPVPDLFVREKEAGGIILDALAANDASGRRNIHPTVLAGKDAIADHSEAGLKFRAGRAIARARPEHILASVLPSAASLRNAAWGAVRVTHPHTPLPPDVSTAAEAYAKQIQPFLQPARLEQLALIVGQLLERGDIDTRSWVQGVAYTTSRAGFILCDSLDVATQVLTRESEEGSPIPVKDRIRDLVAYSVSEPYLKLRREIGLGR